MELKLESESEMIVSGLTKRAGPADSGSSGPAPAASPQARARVGRFGERSPPHPTNPRQLSPVRADTGAAVLHRWIGSVGQLWMVMKTNEHAVPRRST